jgi:azurin
MKLHATVLAAACAFALSACGGESRDTAETATPPRPATTTAQETPKVDSASVPEAPWGQVPADGTTPAAGDTGDTAGNAGDTPGADTTPGTPAAPGASTTGTAATGTAATGSTATGSTATGGTATGAMSGAAAGAGKQAAVSGCAANVEGNDKMQYNVSSIVVPSSCSQFTIKLTHTGQLPVTAMGHNVVVTATSDMAAVAAEGISAGASAGYVKAGDKRIIAATKMVGGGESASVSFDVAKIKSGGPYEFFCSFPGHSALMKGTISVQ